MGRKKIPGLQKRFGVWHIDKKIGGIRVCESTGASLLEEAERILAHKMEEIRQTQVFGIRPKRTFKEAAIKFLRENTHLATLQEYARHIKALAAYIGDLPIEAIHIGSLQRFIEDRRKQGTKTRTINYALQTVRRILNLAAGEWLDDNGLTWLHGAPKIKLLKETDKRKPYPLSWEEQDRLLGALPKHLQNMMLFAVNTGCREHVVRTLRWEWETNIPELNTRVFVVPGYVSDEGSENIATRNVKNGEDCLVVLNAVAKEVIEKVRGEHPDYVFTFRGKPVTSSFNNSAWKKAVKEAGIPVRVHDLKHTFGRRLRAAGVGFEDRQDLLGHKAQGHITTHYSAAEIEKLLEAANKACDRKNCGTLLRTVVQLNRMGSREKLAGQQIFSHKARQKGVMQEASRESHAPYLKVVGKE